MSMPKAIGRGSDQFPLRLPEGMRDQIKASARENGRSMNAEIIARLEQTIPGPSSIASIVKAAVKEAMQECRASVLEE